SGSIDGRISRERLLDQLGWSKEPALLESEAQTAARPVPPTGRGVAAFGDVPRVDRLSVRETLANRHILLIGVTGFIGKVWLVDLLEDVGDLAKDTVVIRQD